MDESLDKYHTMEFSSDQVSLLISLLIRFPQIGTVHYDPVDQALRLVFLLRGVHKKQLGDFLEEFRVHLEIFHLYAANSNHSPLIAHIQHEQNGELWTLEIARDVPSLSREELNLIIQLVSDYFAESLITEGVAASIEDQSDQDAAIASMLSSGTLHCEEKLTGFRERGKVLVFSIPLQS